MGMDILEKIGDSLTNLEREVGMIRHEQQRQGRLLAEVLEAHAECPRCRMQFDSTIPPGTPQ